MPTPSQKKRPGADTAQDILANARCADNTVTGRPCMKDLFKDTLLVGLGAALLTRDKIEESLRRLVDEGKISSQDARQTAASIFEKGESELKGVQEQVQTFVGDRLRSLDLAARSDVEDLARRYHDLEQRFQALDIRLSSLEQKEGAQEGSSEQD